MCTSNRLIISYLLPLLCVLVFFVSRSFPFWFSAIPLGYDPGLYKSMFLAYQALGSSRTFDQLPEWIQTMYEPLLGMQGALLLLINGGWSDHALTWGLVVGSFLPILGIWIVARRRGKQAGLFVLFVSVISFTQYQLFWRSYRKQLIGIFFLMIIVWGWERGKWRHMIPVVSALFLTHRPAAVLICLLAFFRGLILIFRQKFKECMTLRGSCILAFGIALPILLPFREEQFLPLLGPFFSHIDMPTLKDGFQTGGTFLTIREYLMVAGSTFFISLYGFFGGKKESFFWSMSMLLFVILLFWVFGQGFFFQRMIGYLDMIVVLFAGVTCMSLWKGVWRKKTIVVLICIFQLSMLLYRTYRTYRPLIESSEFAFLSQIGGSIENNSIIIVPGIVYSPRIQGRVQRDVLAPGLFDLNRRGALDQVWTTKWLNVSASQKCLNLLQDYPELIHHPVYLWIGSKQPVTDLNGGCFTRLRDGEGWSRWKVEK